MHTRQRFLTLEAMRGLAAICVVLMHGERAFGFASPMSGYLAVDFFFLLSGFIMAHAYEDRLDGGLPKRSFLHARLLRLYPLYLVGTVSTVVLAVASIAFRHQNTLWAYTQPLVSLPLAVWILPTPTTVVLYPLDTPAWSLLLELAANLAFAFAPWRRSKSLLLMVACSSVALLATALCYGSLDFGSRTNSFAPGLARVFFSFPLGIMVYRVRHAIRLPAALGITAPLLLVALLYAEPVGVWRELFDILFVGVASPLLLLGAASHEPAGHLRRQLYMVLGMISYPLYVLHHPGLIAAIGTVERHVPPGWATTVACFGVVAGLIVTAWLAAAVDQRVRQAIAAKRRRSAALRVA